MLKTFVNSFLLIMSLVVSGCGGGGGSEISMLPVTDQNPDTDQNNETFYYISTDFTKQIIQENNEYIEDTSGVALRDYINDRREITTDQDITNPNDLYSGQAAPGFASTLDNKIIIESLLSQSSDGDGYLTDFTVYGYDLSEVPANAQLAFEGIAKVGWLQLADGTDVHTENDETTGTAIVTLNTATDRGEISAVFNKAGYVFTGTINRIDADGTLYGTGNMVNNNVNWQVPEASNLAGTLFGDNADAVGIVAAELNYSLGVNHRAVTSLGIAATR